MLIHCIRKAYIYLLTTRVSGVSVNNITKFALFSLSPTSMLTVGPDSAVRLDAALRMFPLHAAKSMGNREFVTDLLLSKLNFYLLFTAVTLIEALKTDSKCQQFQTLTISPRWRGCHKAALGESLTKMGRKISSARSTYSLPASSPQQRQK